MPASCIVWLHCSAICPRPANTNALTQFLVRVGVGGRGGGGGRGDGTKSLLGFVPLRPLRLGFSVNLSLVL